MNAFDVSVAFAGAAGAMLLVGLQHSARPAARRLGDARAERGRGIRHSVRRQLRRLPRRATDEEARRSRSPIRCTSRSPTNASMRDVIANGVRGTSMPAFAQSAGGMLTDKQIDAIVERIRSRWSKPGVLDGANPPSYAAKSAGDIQRGEAAYQTYCASCHGPDGRGGRRAAPSRTIRFWRWSSDQGLRTIVIVGRPELGAPDWRGNVPGKPMSDQEVTDVVAWLASHRVAESRDSRIPPRIAQH